MSAPQREIFGSRFTAILENFNKKEIGKTDLFFNGDDGGDGVRRVPRRHGNACCDNAPPFLPIQG